MMTLQFAEHTCSLHMAKLGATERAQQIDTKCVTCEDVNLSLLLGAAAPTPAVPVLTLSPCLPRIDVLVVECLLGLFSMK